MRAARPIILFVALLFSACGTEMSGSPDPGGKADDGDASCSGAALDQAGVCRLPNGQFAAAACCAVVQARCTATRVEGIPGEGDSISALIDLEEDAVGDSESLELFEGSYSFGLEFFEDELGVVFLENEHAFDEVGFFTCPVDTNSAVFCEETIEVNKLLGTENDVDLEMVHALDFSCAVVTP